MVTCDPNFQFQVLAFLKGTKELGVAHFAVDAPLSCKFKHLNHFTHLHIQFL